MAEPLATLINIGLPGIMVGCAVGAYWFGVLQERRRCAALCMGEVARLRKEASEAHEAGFSALAENDQKTGWRYLGEANTKGLMVELAENLAREIKMERREEDDDD